MRVLLTFVAALMLAGPAAAQTPPPTNWGYWIDVFASAADMQANRPAGTATVPASDVTWNQPNPPAPGSLWFEDGPETDATVVWDDPDHPGRACLLPDAAGRFVGLLERLRAGVYPWRVRTIGPVSTPSVAGVPAVHKPAPASCVPPAGRTAALAVTIQSTYPQTVARSAQVKVDWRISNVRRVVYAQVLLNGIEVA